ncbi:glycoside hydrolase family 3 N-terminal domain-containing protein [Aestuariimicrobium sp. Y1814]|uniref:glycoside hydrolase family 3 N-terminal domain-containing protein n=1 Tax=Aestuariimicrobium sp. Y1814 TaxID=3418742 RepID=UPI003DA6D418
MTSRRVVLGGLAAGGLTVLAGCATDSGEPPGSVTPNPSDRSPGGDSSTSAASSPSSPASSPSGAAGLSLEAQVGQLIMVGHDRPQLDNATRDLLTTHQVGSLLLLGNALGPSSGIRAMTMELEALDLAAPIIVAVDQEGGQVQRLNGEGFSRIPDAVAQSAMAPAELERAWVEWGAELAGAGVHYNLAPVADVVPADNVSRNAPIGQLRRHYGTTNAAAIPSLRAVVGGLSAAGVATSLKHFPGLGRVSVNTDFGVAVDTVTSATDEELSPFVEAIEAGASSVMVSSAIYEQIDPGQQGVFSSKVITDILRGRLGFEGVVIADDLGAAVAVKDVTPGERALRFLRAGGDLVITADPGLVEEMVSAVLDVARSDEAFADELALKAGRVLALKDSVLPA